MEHLSAHYKLSRHWASSQVASPDLDEKVVSKCNAPIGVITSYLPEFEAINIFAARFCQKILFNPPFQAGGGPRGGTRPRKVRVGDVRDDNLKLYLYKFPKNWGLF